jgi:hypothetical protein
MRDNREDYSELPAPWTHALKILCAGHLLGLASCGAVLAASQITFATFGWLEIATVLFVLGLASSSFAFISMRSAASYPHEIGEPLHSSPMQRHEDILQTNELAARRLLIACLMALSSAVIFFCGCMIAIIAFLQP